MMANMVTSLLRHGRITTTVPKAKELRRVADGLIAHARLDSVHNRRLVSRTVRDKAVLASLFSEIAPRFESVEGGFTRVHRVGRRKGDGAELALVTVGTAELAAPEPEPKRKRSRKRTNAKGKDSKAASAETPSTEDVKASETTTDEPTPEEKPKKKRKSTKKTAEKAD
jgi:large subunit ribosomal protein L17